jgi:hypothetical protein
MTAATEPQASRYDDVVDLSRYPINDAADPAYRALVQAARTSSVTRELPS